MASFSLGALSAAARSIVDRADEAGGKTELATVLSTTVGLTSSVLKEVTDHYALSVEPFEQYLDKQTLELQKPKETSVIDKSKTTTTFQAPNNAVKADDLNLFESRSESPSRVVATKKGPQPKIERSASPERTVAHESKVKPSAKAEETVRYFAKIQGPAGRPKEVHLDRTHDIWSQLKEALGAEIVSVQVKGKPVKRGTSITDNGVPPNETLQVVLGAELSPMEKAGNVLINPYNGSEALALLKPLSDEELRGTVRDGSVSKSLVYLAARGGHLEALQYIESRIGAEAFRELVNTETTSTDQYGQEQSNGRYPVSAALWSIRGGGQNVKVVDFLLKLTDDENLNVRSVTDPPKSSQDLATEVGLGDLAAKKKTL